MCRVTETAQILGGIGGIDSVDCKRDYTERYQIGAVGRRMWRRMVSIIGPGGLVTATSSHMNAGAAFKNR